MNGGWFRLDIGKNFLKMRVVKHWHRFFREVEDVPFLKISKARLNQEQLGLVEGAPAHWQQGGTR